jgi:hypothetical protein
MEYAESRHIGDILKDRNIEIIGADLATRHGFTQVRRALFSRPLRRARSHPRPALP